MSNTLTTPLTSKSRKLKSNRQTIILSVILLAFGGFSIFPFLWMISSSLKETGAIYTYPPEFIPKPFSAEAYIELFNNSDFFRWLKNSAIVTISTIVIQVFISAMAGYAFSKTVFPGRRILFVSIIATLMIPGFALFIPMFIMVVNLGLMNTYAALILPQAASPVGIFLMKQYTDTIPDDLLAAARIDGCKHTRIFTMIILPLVAPALAATAIFAFLGSWNSFFWPLIATTKSKMRTLTVGLAILQSQWSGNWNVVMACSTMTFLPALIIYLSLQRYFVQGIALTGVKG